MYSPITLVMGQSPLVLPGGWPLPADPRDRFEVPMTAGQDTSSGNFKTVICNNWKAGACRFGTNCRFAHGGEELNPTPPRGMVKPELCKTQMCKWWLSDGTCAHGDQCRFAHGDHELKPGPNQTMDGMDGLHTQLSPSLKPELYKTQLCKWWSVNGICCHGSNCSFAHGVHERKAAPPPSSDRSARQARPEMFKTQLCKWWMAGSVCQHAGACRFAHGEHELRALAPGQAMPMQMQGALGMPMQAHALYGPGGIMQSGGMPAGLHLSSMSGGAGGRTMVSVVQQQRGGVGGYPQAIGTMQGMQGMQSMQGLGPLQRRSPHMPQLQQQQHMSVQMAQMAAQQQAQQWGLPMDTHAAQLRSRAAPQRYSQLGAMHEHAHTGAPDGSLSSLGHSSYISQAVAGWAGSASSAISAAAAAAAASISSAQPSGGRHSDGASHPVGAASTALFDPELLDSEPSVGRFVDEVESCTPQYRKLYLGFEVAEAAVRSGGAPVLPLLAAAGAGRVVLIDLESLPHALDVPGPACGRSLRSLLEDGSVPKFAYDVRAGSEALFLRCGGLLLRGVIDLQMADMARSSLMGIEAPSVRHLSDVLAEAVPPPDVARLHAALSASAAGLLSDPLQRPVHPEVCAAACGAVGAYDKFEELLYAPLPEGARVWVDGQSAQRTNAGAMAALPVPAPVGAGSGSGGSGSAAEGGAQVAAPQHEDSPPRCARMAHL
ncbi:hypothetical protein FOA52_012930 [Chlamydomonas sp. UWO 241]|nr:hypothetical protein FOA52_012930 [Chlamydomonas sp. UWO 241]